MDPGRLEAVLEMCENLYDYVDAPLPTVHCFACGPQRDQTLSAIADCYDGEYSYLSKAEEMPTAFADLYGGMLSCVAKHVQVSQQLPAERLSAGQHRSPLEMDPNVPTT